MRKENKIDFVSLLQNETFLNLVKDTDGFVNQLDILDKAFPEKREVIAYILEFLKANQSDQKKMSANDVVAIWQNVRKAAIQNKQLTLNLFVSHNLWKVAAILIVVLISSVLVIQRLTRDPLSEMASSITIPDNDAMIILSDGSRHRLNEKDSLIEYSANGGEVLIKSEQKEQKLKNANSSKLTVINQIVVPFGQRHSIVLCDGTRVQLNSGSRLIYPAEFSGKIREVWLKGEGYFEVTKSAALPFIVRTDFMNIKVLGTVFNISAYNDEPTVYAVLLEGKVEVSQKNKIFGSTEKYLSPGQGCFYSLETKTSDIRKVDLYDYISWKDGLFYFKDKPLTYIVGRLRKYYNQNILIETGKLPNTLISGKLVLPDNLEEVMKYLAKTLEARYYKNRDGDYIIKD